MLKDPVVSVLDLLRKRQGVTALMMVMLILGTTGVFIGCTQNPGSKTGEGIVYNNETLGFSLEFPKSWEDRYIVEESENSIAVFNKKVNDKIGLGLLFSIERLTGELITEEDMKQAPVGQQIILQDNGFTYIARMPSDVQYPPDDEELGNDYQTMSEQVSGITRSISAWGDQKPKAGNEGFKVVGSSYFTVEIPIDWEIKAPEESTLCWNLYSEGENPIGAIELIPYKSEGLGEENSADDNTMREYLFDNETYRETKITVNSEYANQGIMEKIKNSFEFMNGPFNVIDLQYMEQQYLGGGGRNVFGTIEDFVFENGKPVAVQVNVMKFLTDDPGNKYPNGFHIEDLDRIETYSFDWGVNIAPLMAPDYNRYGIYEIPLLDENFINNYKNYKDFFYDFIIGSDGQLKIVLGHYVP